MRIAATVFTRRRAAIYALASFFLLPNAILAQGSKGVRQIAYTNAQGLTVGGYSGSYALLVGVSKYTKGWPNLDAVAGELDEVEAALKQNGFEVRKVINPDSEQLPRAFDKFIKDYGYDKDNRLLFFFSGHGYTLDKGERGYLVPTDAPDPSADEKGFRQKSLDMTDILGWCRKMTAKHALFLFDSCFSGAIFTTRGRPGEPAHISALTDKPVRQFISAGSAGQEVPARSVFTPCFLKALRGDADHDNDGFVVGTELGMYLHNKVTDYTGKTQTPQYGKIKDARLDEGDFVFPLPSRSDAALPELPRMSSTDLVPTTLTHLRTYCVGADAAESGRLASDYIRSILRRLAVDGDGKTLKVIPRKSQKEASDFISAAADRHGLAGSAVQTNGWFKLLSGAGVAADRHGPVGSATQTNGWFKLLSDADSATNGFARVSGSVAFREVEPARALAFLFDIIRPSNGIALTGDGVLFSWSGKDGDLSKVHVEFECLVQQQSGIQVATWPKGATVWVGGKQLGKTPTTVILDPGMHMLVLKSAGYETDVALEIVEAGTVTQFGTTLEPEKDVSITGLNDFGALSRLQQTAAHMTAEGIPAVVGVGVDWSLEDAVRKAKATAMVELRRRLWTKVLALQCAFSDESEASIGNSAAGVEENGVNDDPVPYCEHKEVVYDRLNGMCYVLLVQDIASHTKRRGLFQTLEKLGREVEQYSDYRKKIGMADTADGRTNSIGARSRSASQGIVEAHCFPRGASVWSGGKELGRAPVTLALDAGTHGLVFKKPGYASVARKVDVVTNETTSVQVKLDAEARIIEGDDGDAVLRQLQTMVLRAVEAGGMGAIGIGDSRAMEVAMAKAKTCAFLDLCGVAGEVKRAKTGPAATVPGKNSSGACVYDRWLVERAVPERILYDRKKGICYVLVLVDREDVEYLRHGDQRMRESMAELDKEVKQFEAFKKQSDQRRP